MCVWVCVDREGMNIGKGKTGRKCLQQLFSKENTFSLSLSLARSHTHTHTLCSFSYFRLECKERHNRNVRKPRCFSFRSETISSYGGSMFFSPCNIWKWEKYDGVPSSSESLMDGFIDVPHVCIFYLECSRKCYFAPWRTWEQGNIHRPVRRPSHTELEPHARFNPSWYLILNKGHPTSNLDNWALNQMWGMGGRIGSSMTGALAQRQCVAWASHYCSDYVLFTASSLSDWLFGLDYNSLCVSHVLAQETCALITPRPCYYWKGTTDSPRGQPSADDRAPRWVPKIKRSLLLMSGPTGALKSFFRPPHRTRLLADDQMVCPRLDAGHMIKGK